MQEELIIEKLRKNGYKITPQRQEILKAILSCSAPQSAEEIHHRITEKHPNISLDTVYRNLNVLLSIDAVCKFNLKEGKSSYEINNGDSHHHHLVCLKCGAAESVDFCPLKHFDQKKILEERDFEIKEHRFEIYGYCAACKKN